MKSLPALAFFLILVLGGGLTIGFLTAPGDWYAELNKPPFNPPNWVFGPVWTIIYVCIGVAGWSVWRADRSGLAMKLWWAQLALNFLWSPAFFAAQQVAIALAIIFTLLAVIFAFIATSRKKAPLAAWLFAPYAAWVSFASLLNASIFFLN